ncbi:MAG: ABC transporter permease [Campylobacterota bacterium]|nr:ABC transporter permease [Campylobacterota bacterium]
MSFYNILAEDLKSIKKDIDILLTLIAGVLIYAFFYPQPYLNQNVTNVDIAIVDLDRSKSSRDMIFMIQASPLTNIVLNENSIDEAKKSVLEQKIEGFIVLPENFERDLYLNKMPTVAIGANNSFFLLNKSVVESALSAMFEKSAQLKAYNIMLDGSSQKRAIEDVNMFEFKIHNLFNPQNSYKQYVVPAVFIIILQQMFLIGVALLSAGYSEKIESKGYAGHYKNSNIFLNILSKIIIFTTLFMFYEMLYFGFVFDFFEISKLSNISDLLSFGYMYSLSVVMMGLSLGELLKKRAYVTPIVLATSMPLVFSAAFVWPLQDVEEIVLLISLFFPSNPAIFGFLSLNQMGATLSDVPSQYTILIMQTIFYTLIYIFLVSKNRVSA